MGTEPGACSAPQSARVALDERSKSADSPEVVAAEGWLVERKSQLPAHPGARQAPWLSEEGSHFLDAD